MLHKINNLLSNMNLRIVRSDNHDFIESAPQYRAGERWSRDPDVPKSLVEFIKENLRFSFSQIQQDLVAAWIINESKNYGLLMNKKHFFVEFGATNGYRLSNTFYLEKLCGWNGILSEPARIWQEELIKVRNCSVDFRCVYSESNLTLNFSETSDPELGTLSDFKNKDSHSILRALSMEYPVTSVSLFDLLKEYEAPFEIDYISIDTEGSEYDILRNFDFDSFKFNIITVEHNFTPNRELINVLLSSNGYVRILENISGHDDWYVSDKLAFLFSPATMSK